jgi:pyruvate kinase
MPTPWTPVTGEQPNVDHTRALSEAAVTLARRSGAHAIVAVTREGQTARLLSAARPPAIILAATDSEEVARRLNLWRGVIPMVCDLRGDIEDVISRVVDGAVKRSKAPENATLVFVNTAADLDRGGSNFVRIRRA